MEIIVRHYDHFNRSLGKYISSKRQYENELAKGGYIPYEKAQALAKLAEEKKNKPYTYAELSQKAKDILSSAESSKDKKGNVKLSDRTIDAMKDVGVKFSVPDWCPKHYSKEGGFNAT